MDTQKLAKVMKALSNPNRLELYLEIVKNNEASFKTGGETFINEIIEEVGSILRLKKDKS